MADRLALIVCLALAAAIAVVLARAFVARRSRGRLGADLPVAVALPRPDAPTVVYFYGIGCPGCPGQKAQLDRLRDGAALNVLPVDAAADPVLAGWAGVLTVPSTALVDARRQLRRVNHGFRSAEDLAQQLAEIA